MKTVLILSYSNPFLNIPSGMRIGKYAKYLPQFNWESIIISASNSGIYQEDPAFVIDKVKLYETSSINLHSIFKGFSKNREQKLKKHIHNKGEKLYNFSKMIPPVDGKIGWYPFAMRKARQIIKNEKIDLIFTSLGGIYHPAIMAYQLGKKYHIPYILEFRDLWCDHPFSKMTFYNKIICSHWEKKTVRSAGHILTSAPGMKTRLCTKYGINGERVSVNTNGFDPEDFKEIPTVKKSSNILNMTFCGNFYTILTPEDLFRSILKINKQAIKIKLNFVGSYRSYFWRLMRNYESKLKKINVEICVHPRMQYKELMQFLSSSDIMLAFLPDYGYSNAVYPTKIFDYIALRKPTLAFCPTDSDLDRFIKANNLGFSVNSGDYETGKQTIENILKSFQSGDLRKFKIDSDFTNKFTRKNITKNLVEVFNRVVGD